MPGEHILIVDDERAIRTTLRGVLEDEGYRVTAVG
jgi:CheY-like chemotaxis protein